MSESVKPIESHDKVTALFGVWPSFHDAEVIDLHYRRGTCSPECEVNAFVDRLKARHYWCVGSPQCDGYYLKTRLYHESQRTPGRS